MVCAEQNEIQYRITLEPITLIDTPFYRDIVRMAWSWNMTSRFSISSNSTTYRLSSKKKKENIYILFFTPNIF